MRLVPLSAAMVVEVRCELALKVYDGIMATPGIGTPGAADRWSEILMEHLCPMT